MKFFTPNLLECFGSEDEGVALTALEEQERRSELYAGTLREIRRPILGGDAEQDLDCANSISTC